MAILCSRAKFALEAPICDREIIICQSRVKSCHQYSMQQLRFSTQHSQCKYFQRGDIIALRNRLSSSRNVSVHRCSNSVLGGKPLSGVIKMTKKEYMALFEIKNNKTRTSETERRAAYRHKARGAQIQGNVFAKYVCSG